MIAWVRWVVVAGLVAGASPAWAKIELKCYDGPEAVARLRAELKASDQQPVIIGNRTGGNWNVNLFTSDSKGDVGYNIEGNQRFGSGIESTKLCVAAKYRSIVMNDVSKPSIPSWALVGSDPKIAGPIAKKYGYGAGVHDDTVRKGASNGFYMALGAVTLVSEANGIERDGPLLMVGFGPSDPKHAGSMSITGADGVRKDLFDMIDVQYGPRAMALLNR